MLLKELLEQHGTGDAKLTLRLLVPEEPYEGRGSILIEGAPQSLRFLADLLYLHAEKGTGASIQIHPNGAGNAHFSNTSNLGIYINVK